MKDKLKVIVYIYNEWKKKDCVRCKIEKYIPEAQLSYIIKNKNIL